MTEDTIKLLPKGKTQKEIDYVELTKVLGGTILDLVQKGREAPILVDPREMTSPHAAYSVFLTPVQPTFVSKEILLKLMSSMPNQKKLRIKKEVND